MFGGTLAGTAAICGGSVALLSRRPVTAGLTLPAVSLLVLAAGLGLPLLWQTVAGLRGKPSRRFALSLPQSLVLCVLYVAAVAGGQAVLSARQAVAIALPPFHVIALALPPLLCLGGAAALARAPHFTWRQWWSGLGAGAFGAAGVAFLVELALLVIGLLIAAVALGASPEWVERLREFQRAPNSLDQQALLRSLVGNPAVIGVLLISLSGLVPLIEETAKSLVPASIGLWHRPGAQGLAARAFLWGVAGGAGFAVLEGLLNGGLSVQEWGSVALLRVGSSAMHCLTTGLVGWGWGGVWAERRWLRLAALYAVAIAIHGVWNATSIGMAVAGAAFTNPSAQTAIVGSAALSLVALTIGEIVALLWLARHVSGAEYPVGRPADWPSA
jgi:hypothetical protein